MKKLLSLFLVIVLTAIIFTSCQKTDNNALDNNDKLIIYTSFYPMYYFTSIIAGDKAEVYNMIPAGTEPHEWEPATKDIVNLESADIFIYNGLNIENWVEKVLGSLENKKLIITMASEGIATIKDGEITDPHIWLSIKKASMELENIAKALTDADPENKQYYEDNLSKYMLQFGELDEKFREELSNLKNNTIVVSHEAFGYLADEYGLVQLAIEGIEPDSEPSAERMSEIIKFINENNITTVFFEELSSSKVAEVIAGETDAVTAVLNPIEGLTQQQIDSGEDYLSIMQQNLEVLTKALK